MTQEEDGPAPEVNGHAEEVDEKEAVKSEQVKEKEAESHSNASADTEVRRFISIHSTSGHMLEDKSRQRGSPIGLFAASHADLPMICLFSKYTNKSW